MYNTYGEGLGYASGKKCIILMVKGWGMPQVRSV